MTSRQLSLWQRALATGAMARAVVVIAAGIQDASLYRMDNRVAIEWQKNTGDKSFQLLPLVVGEGEKLS